MAKRSQPKKPRERSNTLIKAEDPNERNKLKIKPPLSVYLLDKTLEALGSNEYLSEEDAVTKIKWLISMVKGVKPTDEIEAMLATQMIATHEAALNCLSLSRDLKIRPLKSAI